MEMLSIVEYRRKYGKSPFTIRNGLINGRFPKAKKIGRFWFLPDEPPIDRRTAERVKRKAE